MAKKAKAALTAKPANAEPAVPSEIAERHARRAVRAKEQADAAYLERQRHKAELEYLEACEVAGNFYSVQNANGDVNPFGRTPFEESERRLRHMAMLARHWHGDCYQTTIAETREDSAAAVDDEDRADALADAAEILRLAADSETDGQIAAILSSAWNANAFDCLARILGAKCSRIRHGWTRARDAEIKAKMVKPTARQVARPEGRRPAYLRDHLWLKWQNELALTNAAIRDKWNALRQSERNNYPKHVSPLEDKQSGRETVRKGIATASEEAAAEKKS